MTTPIPLVIAALSFALSMGLAAPGLCWFDSGELALAAGTLGVAHPPGQPAYLVLAALAALFPIGDLSFRLTVLSAASLAVAAGLLAAIASRFAEELMPTSSARRIVPVLAGGLLALSPAAITQAVRPELYAPSVAVLLSAVAALVLLRGRGPALAVLALCVAGAVHYAVLVVAVPGLAILALRRGRIALQRAVGVALILLGPGLLQYLWLPLRSQRSPVLDFGHPQNLERFLWVVTAGPYRRSFGLADGQLVENAWAHLELALLSLGPLSLLFALAGLALCLLRSRSLALAGLLVLGLGSVPTLFQGLFAADNPDLWGYLLMPLAALACSAALGMAAVLAVAQDKIPVVAKVPGGLFCLALLLGPALSSVQNADHSRQEAPARFANALLDGSPQGGVLALSGDSWLYPAMYQRYWEGRRADLQVLPLLQLNGHTLDALVSRDVLSESTHLSDQSRSLEAIPARVRQEHYLRLLARSLRERPLLVNEAFVPPELELAKRDEGLLYRLSGDLGSGHADASETGSQREERLWSELFAPLAASKGYQHDETAHGVFARRFGARAGYYSSRGRSKATSDALHRGVGLQPDHGDIIYLARYRLAEGVERVVQGDSLVGRVQGPWLGAFSRGQDRAAELLLDSQLAVVKGEDELELRVLRGSARLLHGDLAGAQDDVQRVLEEAPFHPGASLIRERLYSLGRAVRPSTPLTGPRTSQGSGGGDHG